MWDRTSARLAAWVAALSCTVTVVVTVVVTVPSEASACSLEPRPQPLRVVPGAVDSDVPSNVIFSPPSSRGGLDAGSYFWAVDGDAADLEVDSELTALLTFEEPYADLSTTVYRPLSPLQAGDAIAACYRDRCGEERSTVTDEVDTTPPTRPVVETIEITLFDNPGQGRGTFCPELDFIQLEVSASDDTTPLAFNRVLIYAGPTRDSVPTADAPSAAISGEPTGNGDRLRIESWLGLDSERVAYYSPFSRTAEVCFSLALMDWAGNISERSEVECVDTRDSDGPYANIVKGSGCGCSSVRGPLDQMPSLLAFFVGLLLLRMHRRRR